MKKTIALAIIYRKNNSNCEFLLIKRVPEEGGFWQPPGGGVETKDKSCLEAAFREAKEEVGLDKNSVIRIIEGVYSFTINKHYITKEPIDPVVEYTFAFEVNPSWVPRIDHTVVPEHTEFRWVSFDDAIKLLKWQNNKDAFNKLKEILKII